MHSKSIFVNFLIFMMLVTTFLPIVANNLPQIVGSFHFYGPLFILYVLLLKTKLLLHINISLTIIIGLFTAFIFPLTIWWSIDEWNLRGLRVEYYEILSALLVYYYLYVNKYYKSMAIFVKIALLFIGVTMILTYYSASIDPMYARMITGNWYEDEAKKEFFDKIGGGNYSTALSIMSLLPMVVYFYKNNTLININKFIVGLYGFSIYITLFKLQFFGNILLGTVFLIVALQAGKRIKRTIIIIGIVSILALFIPNHFYSAFFT